MTATARLDLRMNAQDRDKIARAAKLRGLPVATFVRLAALREAEAMEATSDGADTVALSSAETSPVLSDEDKALFGEGHRASPGRSTARLTDRLRGRASTRMSTDEIMQLTRGA